MASLLVSLCLREIFKYFCVSEGEKCNKNEINYNRRQLYHFALVNRHWCDTAIPLLWGGPFPSTSVKADAVFISTLLNCFDTNGQESRPLFQYNLFIKQLSLKSLSNAIINWSKSEHYSNQPEARKNAAPESLLKKFKSIRFNRSNSKRYHNQQNNKTPENLLETFKAMLHNFIDSTENTFFEIELDEIGIDMKVSGDYYNFNYNIFQIPNSKVSLEQLHSLKLSFTDSTELLESASKTCPNLSMLEMIFYLTMSSESRQILSHISSFAKLKSLSINCINPIDVSFYEQHNGDQLIDELGKILPKRLETLLIKGYLNFSVDSFKSFFHGAKGIHFKSLEFPYTYLSDELLEIILEVINDSSLDVGIQQIGADLTSKQMKKFKDHGIALKNDKAKFYPEGTS
ncbi:4965_t:CDS:1 [Ambispora gerdemannii]|uniref:4965_t:CDS:1 n=1 Tax=Ambispora gerdemannii TaxID=144530 RepID=A0A9N9GW94_9GLOM|nr:4965_t:CDS:1 [Ambispora gerdemannii]